MTVPVLISATAEAAGLTTLASALQKAGLTDTVNGIPDVTIFAPANAAFDAISSVLASISTPDLKNVLTYHVVKGAVGYSTDLKDGQILPTVQGGTVTVHIRDGKIFINDAQVVVPDVVVQNGVVHVINRCVLSFDGPGI